MRRGSILPVPVTKRDRGVVSVKSKSLGFLDRAGWLEASEMVDMVVEKKVSRNKGKKFFQIIRKPQAENDLAPSRSRNVMAGHSATACPNQSRARGPSEKRFFPSL